MLENIKKELTYIMANIYGEKTTVIIDDKEYSESEIYADGECTVYPESLEDQLQRLVPDADDELVEEFVDKVKEVTTVDGLEAAKKEWDSLVKRNGGTENA